MASLVAISSAPGTGSRRRLEPSERVPQILEAALAEFAERGYGGARMAAVATRAGVAKGLVYHYFPSKPALFLATVRACTQPVFEAAERRLAEPGGDAAAVLRSLIGIAYDQACGGPRERALFKLIIAEAERVPELARFYREEVLARATAVVDTVLRAGAASGAFRPALAGLPGLAAVVLAPAIMAAVWHMILGVADAPAPGPMARAQVELLLAGLGADSNL